jgi:hypothetical protein
MRTTDERARKFGEVLTPKWMVQNMLTSFTDSIMLADKPCLDLCAGQGAFISFMLELQLNNLRKQKNTEQNIILLELFHNMSKLIAIELQEDNRNIMLTRLKQMVEEFLLEQDIKNQETVLFYVEQILQLNLIQANILTDEIKIPIYSRTQFSNHIQNGLNKPLTVEYKSIENIDWYLIVSNPPYQKNISGSTEDKRLRNHSKATPVYQFFIDWARLQEPDNLVFIVPSKWMQGGWGLDKWRLTMLSDTHIKKLVDYRDPTTVFEKTEVNGGICWFWWCKDYTGDCEITRYNKAGDLVSTISRPLLETGADFYVRDEQAISILKKIGSFHLKEEESFTNIILGTTPFALRSNFKQYSLQKTTPTDLKLFYIKEKEYWVGRNFITNNEEFIGEWKIFLPLSYNQYSNRFIGKPHIYGADTVCTHSYLAIVGFKDRVEAENCVSYMQTKFFRFLVGQLKISPIATRRVYRLIPLQDWSKPWTDKELYSFYNFSQSEIKYIENLIPAW